MTLRDMLSVCFDSLRRQKLRALFSLVGIVIGSLILLFSIASREGVQTAVARVFAGSRFLREIHLSARWHVPEEDIPESALEVDGEFDEPTRRRIRKMLVSQWQREHALERRGMNAEAIRAMERIDHVEAVLPDTRHILHVQSGERELKALCVGVAADERALPERIVVGEAFASDSDLRVLINEFVAWQWGYKSHEAMRELIGQTVRIESRSAERSVARTLAYRSGLDVELTDEEAAALNRALDRLPEFADRLPLTDEESSALLKALPRPTTNSEGDSPPLRIVSREFTICGIFRTSNDGERERRNRFAGDDAGCLIPLRTAVDFALKTPSGSRYGLHSGIVRVDDEAHLASVEEEIQELGFETHSLKDFVARVQEEVRKVTLIVSAIALFAMLVSALGIANTMIMSVVERTREIGIMKAVGARDRDVLLLFLFEGGLLGLLGGLLALAIGLIVRLPLHSWIVGVLTSELNRPFDEQQVFVFAPWLMATVVLFSTLVTTVSALLPAFRAARVDPVVALRHD